MTRRTTTGRASSSPSWTCPTGVSVGTPAETTVSITDDDVPSVEVSFEQNSYTVAEGSTVTVKVRLSAEPEREVIIPITKANPGPPATTTTAPANVTFNSGDTEWTSASPPPRTTTTTERASS